MSQILVPGWQNNGDFIDNNGKHYPKDDALNSLAKTQELPAYKYIQQFNDIISGGSKVTIVQGATGSGKTTVLPFGYVQQFPNSVLTVTQPRVIAAMSNSEQVSKNLMLSTGNPDFTLGYGVGVSTGSYKNFSRESSLMFATDGTELNRWILSKKYPDIIMLDEIHNFSICTEILALLAKRRAMQIVVTSATLDPQIFRDYFSSVTKEAAHIQIPGRQFPIEYHPNDPRTVNELVELCIQKNNHTLLFAPGKKEIHNLVELLQKQHGTKVEVLPLYSELPQREKDKIIAPPTGGKIRIIVSTNIAEESITIPYIKAVIDLGLQKTISYDNEGTPILQLEAISQAQAEQRKGRTGRTSKGEAYRLESVNGILFEELPTYPLAPLQRERLDREILVLLRDNKKFIEELRNASGANKSLFMHPVHMAVFENSIRELQALGALSENEELTNLGAELTKYPLSIPVARMLHQAIQEGCSKEILPLCVIIEKKGFLSKSKGWQQLLSKDKYNSDLEAYLELLQFARSREISLLQREILVSHGVSVAKLNEFSGLLGTKELYEVVPLDAVGIKTKRITDIVQALQTLEQSLLSKIENRTLESKELARKISLCIAVGSNPRMYKFQSELRLLESVFHGRNAKKFKQGDVSIIELQTGQVYSGEPFSVEQEDGKLLSILSFITPHSPKILREVKEILSANQKDIYAHDEQVEQVSYEAQNINYASSNKSYEQNKPKGILNFEALTPLGIDDLAQDFTSGQVKSTILPLAIQQNAGAQEFLSKLSSHHSSQALELMRVFAEKNLPESLLREPNKLVKALMDDVSFMSRFISDPSQSVQRFLKTRELVGRSIGNEGIDPHVRAAQIAFIKEAADIKDTIRNIDLANLSQEALKRKIRELFEIHSISEDTSVIEAVAEVQNTFAQYGVKNQESVKELLKTIKKNKNKMFQLLKLEEAIVVQDTYAQRIRSGDLDALKISVVNNAIDHGFYGAMSDSLIKKLEKYRDQLTSGQGKKRKNGNGPELPTVLSNALNEGKLILQARKEQLLSGFEQEERQVLQKLFQALTVISESILDADYVRLNIQQHFYKAIRDILGNSPQQIQDLDGILLELLERNSYSSHFVGQDSERFKFLSRLKDIYDEMLEYTQGGAVQRYVIEQKDLEVIQDCHEKLLKLQNQLALELRHPKSGEWLSVDG